VRRGLWNLLAFWAKFQAKAKGNMLQRRFGSAHLWLAIAMAMLAFGCGTNPVPHPAINVRVNELSSSNHDYQDAVGGTDDWIELYNLNEDDANLAGYFISDSRGRRFKVELSDAAVVPGHGVLLLWADAEPLQGQQHLDFKLSSDGDGVCFSNPQGYAVDCIEFSAIPPYDAGTESTSLGRFPDGAGIFQWCNTSSPDEINGSQCAQPAH